MNLDLETRLTVPINTVTANAMKSVLEPNADLTARTSDTSVGTDGNMIGVAVGVPPDVAVKNLRHLQAELAQRLFTHVSLAEDKEGIMVFEWSVSGGQGNRISIIDEHVVASNVSNIMDGTMVFFDVDTSGCRLRRRRNHAQSRCFTDLRAAATYLTLELARTRSLNGTEMLPIRDITWKKKLVELEMAPSLMSPLALAIVFILLFVGICSLCTGVIAAIVRVRRKRQKVVFAPHWAIPGMLVFVSSFEGRTLLLFHLSAHIARENGLYHPPTPPDSNSPEYGNDEDQYKKLPKTLLAPVVDEESPFLLAVRRGDHKSVQQMIHSSENFIDAIGNTHTRYASKQYLDFHVIFFYVDENGLGVLHHAVANNDAKMLQILIDCGQLDLFERNTAGQSPLLFAARLAHPDLECVSILVKAIDDVRKRRHDDMLSEHFDDVEANRRELLKVLPLFDEADAKYALTDAFGRNVMHYAALYNAPHLINYFVACGANVNLIDINGDAPIHLAARDSNVEALVALIRNNCDINVRDGSGDFEAQFKYF
ncbi:ankyrin repeat protein [Ancylostoma caninum]|uniref:Ankyrin repeat protein n=1 Tax=Ancylostoma caninum TaxID=29170 RepID=A0A368FGY6_ANCCA|nr:ankyrin repeat protein [Ancylostoma caninum]